MFSTLLIVFLFIVIIVLIIKCARQSLRLKEIRRVVNAMAKGDFTSKLEFTPTDKLGDVARHMNELSLGIQQKLHELINEKEKLQAIISSMAEGVLVLTVDGKLLHLSPNFKGMIELRSNEWFNKYYWEIISNQNINESIREAIDQKKVVKKDVALLHPKEMYFSMIISPVLDPNRNIISLAVVLHDVTELKKYERLRTEFVANVSHELKTPLTSIKGFAETLQNGGIDDKANAQHFLNIIIKQTNRLENIVNDLLILSSLESKEVKMNFTKSNITSVISSVILMKKGQIEARNQHLTLELAANLPLIMIDTQRMEQVFINLFDNAIKFTPADGMIKIKAEVQGDFLKVDVIDNGPGISSEYLNRIFERFFRVDKSRSQDTGGTGLGLSIIKHIIEAHKGKVSVESALGKGSCFSVFLPINMI